MQEGPPIEPHPVKLDPEVEECCTDGKCKLCHHKAKLRAARKFAVGVALMVTGSFISLHTPLPIDSHLIQDVLAYFLHGVGAAAFVPALEPWLFGV